MPSTALIDFVTELEQQNPQFAAAMTAAGLTRHFIAFLGSPAWALKGTKFSPGNAIPVRITMAEDLRLLANIEARLGLAEMLRQLQDWPHTFAETYFLNAPDLMAALDLLVTKVDRSNDHLGIQAQQVSRGLALTLVPDARIGPFRSLIVMLTIGFIDRLVTRLCSFGAVPQLELLTDDPQITALEWPPSLQVRSLPAIHDGETTLVVPQSLLAIRNPSHLPTLWEHIVEDEGLNQTLHDAAEQLDQVRLAELFSATLRSKHRLPQHAEIARMFHMSERTLARRLARQGLSLRKIGETARREAAMHLLAGNSISVGQIAAQLGYSDAAGFSRSFKSWTGKTPLAWRAANRPSVVP